MAPRKGLSFDEKRERLLQIFTDSADFFTLKELEKIAYKKKGIVSQSVKEVLQSLCDDDLVNTDKCGNQTVYWCLPSEAAQKRKVKLSRVKTELASSKKELARLKTVISDLKTGREESDERTAVLEKLKGFQTNVASLDADLAKFSDFDPDSISKMKQSSVQLREGANRWTDNIFNCQSWAVSKFGMDRKDFGRQFEIPEDLDYLELSEK